MDRRILPKGLLDIAECMKEGGAGVLEQRSDELWSLCLESWCGRSKGCRIG